MNRRRRNRKTRTNDIQNQEVSLSSYSSSSGNNADEEPEVEKLLANANASTNVNARHSATNTNPRLHLPVVIPPTSSTTTTTTTRRTRKKILCYLFLICAAAALSSIFKVPNIRQAYPQAKTSLRKSMGPPKRITSPYPHTSLFGEVDDLGIGKSCTYSHTSHRWHCQDCGLELELDSELDSDGTTSQSHGRGHDKKCKKLPRRKKCPAFKMQGWDAPKPRSSSTYNSRFTRGTTTILTKYGVGKPSRDEYELAHCSLHAMNGGTKSSSLCFDLDRCMRIMSTSTNNTTKTKHPSKQMQMQMQLPMKIYAHGENSKNMLERAIRIGNRNHNTSTNTSLIASLIEITNDANNACLLFASSSDAITATKSPQWNLGKNHFIIRENVGDFPFGPTQHAMAALGSNTFSEAGFRSGYDVAVPMGAKWKVPGHLQRDANDVGRTRPYLLTFKGSIQNSLQPYYQHRWLAAEYLWNVNEQISAESQQESGGKVKIDVQCKKMNLISGKRIIKGYDESPSAENYNDMMLNSTFGFCPGGSGISSYRFAEVLSAGGIPVVVAGTIPVLSPEVDWSGCIVVVSEARIVDLPRILRMILLDEDEIRDRRDSCRQLYLSLYSSNDLTIAFMMRVWVQRIENAIREKETFARLNDLMAEGN